MLARSVQSVQYAGEEESEAEEDVTETDVTDPFGRAPGGFGWEGEVRCCESGFSDGARYGDFLFGADVDVEHQKSKRTYD